MRVWKISCCGKFAGHSGDWVKHGKGFYQLSHLRSHVNNHLMYYTNEMLRGKDIHIEEYELLAVGSMGMDGLCRDIAGKNHKKQKEYELRQQEETVRSEKRLLLELSRKYKMSEIT